MKKLLMFLFLMTISLGQSQTLRLGFESGESGNAFAPFGDFSISPVEAGTGTNTSLVMPIVANAGGQIWQGTNFVLTTPVELIASKTMTIDVLSSVPVTFLMKVNAGVAGALEAAAQASHNGDGTWQTISFTFNTSLDGKAATANGVYNNMVLHPFFPFSGSPSAQTFYIDNISGPAVTPPPSSCTNGIQDGTETGIDCGGTCSPCPAFTVAAPTPTQAAVDVISVYSNTYTNLPGTDFYPNWGQSTTFSEFSPVVGNPTLKYSNLNYQGNQFASPIDASSMENLHIDIWTPDCTSFQVYLISPGSESPVTVTPTLSGWNSYDIPLSSYPAVNKANLIQFKYVGSGTVYLDNIFFWKTPAGSLSYYVDADGDGYGAGAATVSSTPIAGSVTNATDCNDSSNVSYPGATEIADGLDNDCDGSVDEGFPPSTAAPTPPARNAWDVVSIYSDAYSNVGLNELPTGWSQLGIAPFSVESIGGNDTWKFGGEFIGMVTNYDNGVNLSDMTMMHIDYWTADSNLIIAKLVNTIDGGDGTAILEDPTQTGSWRSRDIPLSAFGALNRSKITQLLIDPQSGGSTVYVDNFYFYRPATGAPSPTITGFTVPAKVVGDANFELTAPSSNSTGGFTYTSSNESVATISGTTVTIVGAGSSIITATQAAAGSYGAGSTTATLVVSLATSAPAPIVPGDRVLSIFSDAAGYANVAGTNFYPNWGQATQYALESIAGNPTLRYSNLNYQGIQLASPVDAATYDTVHLNVYGAGTSAVDFRLINQAGEAGSGIPQIEVNSALTLAPGWNTFELPLSTFVGLDLSRIGQMMFVGSGTIYVDNIFFSKAIPTPVAPTVADITFCKGAVSALTAIPSGTNALRWYSSATSTTVLASAPIPTATKTYYVAQVMSDNTVSPRAAITATVNPLPSTPASMTTSDAVLCKNIGTTNPVTYTVPAVVGIEEYSWSLPAGVTATSATDTNAITVNFLGASTSTSVGGIGTISARAINSFGCLSAPRALVLTSKLPTSPTSLTLTSADTNANFNSGIPAVPTSLSQLTKITKVGAYMGTGIVFTLTAPPAPTAASYAWTLPAGVNQLSGDNSNVITIDFAGVTPGIGLLPVSVKSVGGCGQSAVARTLNLSRALPTAPTALVLTDDAISTTAITKVSAYTGKTTPLTLTATPARVQGATATSYAWRLPDGVNIVSPATTATTISLLENEGTAEVPVWVTNTYDALSTGTASTITVNFAGVETGELSFPLTVYAVNGAGNSKARTRTVTAAAPTSPAITAADGTTFNSCTPETYTVVQTLGTSYAWTIPAGATASSLTGNTIVVDYTNVVASVGATVQVTCTASNGTGSSTAKVLNVKRVLCPVRLSGSSASAFSAKAYPNPSSSEFTIETSAKGAMSVKVYDMQGRLVEKADTNRVGAKLAAGTYNVIVNQGANTKSVRVIKN